MRLKKRTAVILFVISALLVAGASFVALGSGGSSSSSSLAEPTAAVDSPTPNPTGTRENPETVMTPDGGQSAASPSPSPVGPSATPTILNPAPTQVAPAATSTVVPLVAATSTTLPPTSTPNPRPHVVSVSPEEGSVGLPLTHAVFVITFSEPMDTTVTQSKIFTSQVCLGASTFEWDASGTVLTFTTCSSFAPGTDFNLTILQTARDASGLEMLADFEAPYRVLRQATTTLYSQPSFDGDVLKPGFLGLDPNPDVTSTEIVVSIQQRGNLSFDLSLIPASAVEIVNADLSVFQKSHAAAAYGATGSLLVRSFSYGTLDQGDYEWTCALGVLCLSFYQKILSSSALDGWKTVSVTEWANEDWQQRKARGSRSQFQLRFANDAVNPAPANGSAAFQAGDVTDLKVGQVIQMNRRPALEVTYLYP